MILYKGVWYLSGSSAKPNTIDLEVRGLTENAMSGKAELIGRFGSAKETIHKVVGDVFFLTLTFVDIIFELPEGPTVPINLLVHLVDTNSLLIRVIDEEGFEVIEDKVSWWQKFSIVLGFLLLLLWSWCWLSSSLLLWFFFFNFSANWFQGLGSHCDVSVNFLEL